MFLTHNFAEEWLPLEFGKGVRGWRFIEKELFTLSFLLNLDVVAKEEDGGLTTRTFWINDWSDIVAFLKVDQKTECSIEGVNCIKNHCLNLIVPPHSSDTGRWKIEPIQEVLSTKFDLGIYTRAYKLESGGVIFEPRGHISATENIDFSKWSLLYNNNPKNYYYTHVTSIV